MSDSLHPVAVARPGASREARPGPSAGNVPVVGVAAMSLEDYARVVQTRTEFVDFLLAPARGELAGAA